MQLSFLMEWWVAFTQELRNHKLKVATGFLLVTFATILIGYFWPPSYQSSALLYADQQDIIKPLLKGTAEVTGLDRDQMKAIRDRLYSRQILEQAAQEAGLAEGRARAQLQTAIDQIRSGLSVEEVGRSHLRVSYRSLSPQKAYEVTSAVVQTFIEDTAAAQRSESKEAFSFIDAQVKTYKQQLQEAEERLKQFKSANTDGTEADVNRRLSSLRAKIEELKLDREEALTRRDELKQQLSQESEFINRRYKVDVYRERLQQAQSQLETLRLSYEDTYPDIVALKHQIEDLQQAIREAQNEPVSGSSSSNAGVNPVYEELRARLAEAEVDLRTLNLRLESTKKMMAEEQERASRVAEYQAELSELTRDYDVTKSIYEDMLERKEKARLSMTLNVQGHGVTYEMQEPPFFPEKPVGLRFIHFYLAAPLAGLLGPVALLLVYIQLDPRFRFPSRLEASLPEGVPLLAVVPRMMSPSEVRAHRMRWSMVSIMFVAALLVYGLVAVLRLTGVI